MFNFVFLYVTINNYIKVTTVNYVHKYTNMKNIFSRDQDFLFYFIQTMTTQHLYYKTMYLQIPTHK